LHLNDAPHRPRQLSTLSAARSDNPPPPHQALDGPTECHALAERRIATGKSGVLGRRYSTPATSTRTRARAGPCWRRYGEGTRTGWSSREVTAFILVPVRVDPKRRESSRSMPVSTYLLDAPPRRGFRRIPGHAQLFKSSGATPSLGLSATLLDPKSNRALNSDQREGNFAGRPHARLGCRGRA
jgi:hypothetical protein